MADDSSELIVVLLICFMCCFSSLLGGLFAYYTGKLCDYGYGCSASTTSTDTTLTRSTKSPSSSTTTPETLPYGISVHAPAPPGVQMLTTIAPFATGGIAGGLAAPSIAGLIHF
jgi:hypothetical protein